MVEAGHRLSLYIGFGRYLLREFRWPLTIFVVLVVGGGVLLKATYHKAALSYVQACHAVFMMLFAQPTLELPGEWYLQPMFFVVPLVGLGVIADSLVRLGFLLFTRKQKLQEWQIMKASLMRQHIIIVGAGKVGYRIVTELLAMNQQVVVVDRLEDSPLITEIRDLGVTVIRGDGRAHGATCDGWTMSWTAS
ncbi:MAG TPA: NAD-binding protein [Methylomirabilota bacterium]|nr:NAD-binding protein [Methylomirabilota bacterium]